jgi:hypothetical protein
MSLNIFMNYLAMFFAGAFFGGMASKILWKAEYKKLCQIRKDADEALDNIVTKTEAAKDMISHADFLYKELKKFSPEYSVGKQL